jgi:hypothetical protein
MGFVQSQHRIEQVGAFYCDIHNAHKKNVHGANESFKRNRGPASGAALSRRSRLSRTKSRCIALPSFGALNFFNLLGLFLLKFILVLARKHLSHL